MDSVDKGQLVASAADVYDEFFLPALFAAWAEPVAEAARISEGDAVLDVACGTGVLTRAVADRVGPVGRAVGLDPNEAMLQRARRIRPEIEWRKGVAERLPFEDGSFDAVVSQFGLMFFEDRVAAIREMARVLRPQGRLAVAVWDTIDHSPGYAEMRDVLRRLFGEEIARSLDAPFNLGDPDVLRACFDEAGISDVSIETLPGTARFPSVESWVHTDVKGWTLADVLDDAQYKQLQQEAGRELTRFERPDGSVEFAAPAHIVTWRTGAAAG